jgi:hypothetical protein
MPMIVAFPIYLNQTHCSENWNVGAHKFPKCGSGDTFVEASTLEIRDFPEYFTPTSDYKVLVFNNAGSSSQLAVKVTAGSLSGGNLTGSSGLCSFIESNINTFTWTAPDSYSSIETVTITALSIDTFSAPFQSVSVTSSMVTQCTVEASVECTWDRWDEWQCVQFCFIFNGVSISIIVLLFVHFSTYFTIVTNESFGSVVLPTILPLFHSFLNCLAGLMLAGSSMLIIDKLVENTCWRVNEISNYLVIFVIEPTLVLAATILFSMPGVGL